MCRFLLVSLCIDAILGEVTVSERKRKLNEMTKGNHLGDAYAATLDRVKVQKGSRSRLGMEALMWSIPPLDKVCRFDNLSYYTPLLPPLSHPLLYSSLPSSTSFMKAQTMTLSPHTPSLSQPPLPSNLSECYLNVMRGTDMFGKWPGYLGNEELGSD